MNVALNDQFELNHMKKLTSEEFNELTLRGTGRGSVFYKSIIGLRVGEALFISKEEYTLSHTPGRICKMITKRFPHVKYTFGILGDGSGWAVKRES